ncbi:MAG: hypothetical protein AAGD86_04245 [Pseudomonadota bacterium]
MSAFVALAAAMVVVACGIVVLPLTRRGADSNELNRAVARTATVAVVVVLPLAALTLYQAFSNWTWEAPAAAAPDGAPRSIPEMVAGLEQRLAQGGGTVEEWHMLARSYLVLERIDESVQAFARAVELAGGGSAELKLDYADALLAADANSVTGRAGQLIEAALVQAPTSRKALWYGGSLAYPRGDFAVAAARWQTLLDGNPPPPDAMRKVLEDNIAAARAELGQGPEQPESQVAGSATGAEAVAVSVALSPALADGVPPGTPLFIIARVAGQKGAPPVAVQRRAAGELPLSVTLSDADAMLPSRRLSSFDEVEIVARLSLGGSPIAAPGDLYGTVNYNKGTTPSVSVLIDKVYP